MSSTRPGSPLAKVDAFTQISLRSSQQQLLDNKPSTTTASNDELFRAMTQPTIPITTERADHKTRHDDFLNATATHKDENAALRTLITNKQPPQMRITASVVETIPYFKGGIKDDARGFVNHVFELRLQRHRFWLNDYKLLSDDLKQPLYNGIFIRVT